MKYSFEILCIEPEDLKNEKSFSKGLSFSDSLWKGKEPEEKVTKGITSLIQPELELEVKIVPLDTSKMFTDYVETAFILTAASKNFNELEEFRKRLLRHLKAKLSFEHIRILRDDISTFIANDLYPKINEVENTLRRYLVKFFTQRVGVDWWEVTANKKMIEKVKMRKKDRKDEFLNYIVTDIEYADFDDLGHLIYKQSSGFNEPEKALEQIINIKKIEDLESFQKELQGNYIKYFKENFRDKNFEKLWIELFKIRNKVAHQGTFYKQELDRGRELHNELISLIVVAEEKIDELVLNIEEKEAIYQASINALANKDNDELENQSKLPGLKVIGKIELSGTASKVFRGHPVITEQELIEELEKVESAGNNKFVGLKWFVTEYLAEKSYSIGFSYSLLNILAERGRIDLYDVDSFDGSYTIKAVKSNHEYKGIE